MGGTEFVAEEKDTDVGDDNRCPFQTASTFIQHDMQSSCERMNRNVVRLILSQWEII